MSIEALKRITDKEKEERLNSPGHAQPLFPKEDTEQVKTADEILNQLVEALSSSSLRLILADAIDDSYDGIGRIYRDAGHRQKIETNLVNLRSEVGYWMVRSQRGVSNSKYVFQPLITETNLCYLYWIAGRSDINYGGLHPSEVKNTVRVGVISPLTNCITCGGKLPITSKSYFNPTNTLYSGAETEWKWVCGACLVKSGLLNNPQVVYDGQDGPTPFEEEIAGIQSNPDPWNPQEVPTNTNTDPSPISFPKPKHIFLGEKTT